MKDNDSGLFSCRNTSWIAGALLGFVVFLLIGGLWGVIVGVIAAVAIALVLVRLFCQPIAGETGAGVHVPTVARDVAVASGAGASGTLGHEPEDTAAAEAAASAMTGDEEVAASISGATGRTTVATALDEAAVAEEPPAQASGEAVLEEEIAASEAAPAPKATPQAVAEKAGAADGKPEMLAEPKGEADDLKLIKGVGPKLEALLNDLGVWHYSQIASWHDAEVAWVDENLKGFKGRVSRDGWVEQAKKLAAGEATEFSQRASKTGMYEK